MMQSMGWQRAGHDLAIEQQQLIISPGEEETVFKELK